jgi:predicted transcriptional regulator
MAKHTTIEQCAEALRKSGGFASGAAKMLGISEGALSQRIKKSEKLRQVKTEIEEFYLDLAETKLIAKIRNEDLGAICFYLKCKGKQRGYVERQEITGANGSPITAKNINIEMTEEEAARLYKENLRGE